MVVGLFTDPISQFSNLYENDFNGNEVKIEIQQFHYFKETEMFSSPEDKHILIHSNKLNVSFPNFEIALRLYLILPVGNPSGKSSFSAVKGQNNYFLRNS